MSDSERRMSDDEEREREVGLGDDVEEGEIGAHVAVRDDAVNVTQCGNLSSADVMGLFPDQEAISKVEWISDDSCNVLFASPDACAAALANATKDEDGRVPAAMKQGLDWWFVQGPEGPIFIRPATAADKQSTGPRGGDGAFDWNLGAAGDEAARSKRAGRFKGVRVGGARKSHLSVRGLGGKPGRGGPGAPAPGAARRSAIAGALAGMGAGGDAEEDELAGLADLTNDWQAGAANDRRQDSTRLGRTLQQYEDLYAGSATAAAAGSGGGGGYGKHGRARAGKRAGGPRRKQDLRDMVLSRKALGERPTYAFGEGDGGGDGEAEEGEVGGGGGGGDHARGRGAAVFGGGGAFADGEGYVGATAVPEIHYGRRLSPQRGRGRGSDDGMGDEPDGRGDLRAELGGRGDLRGELGGGGPRGRGGRRARSRSPGPHARGPRDDTAHARRLFGPRLVTVEGVESKGKGAAEGLVRRGRGFGGGRGSGRL